MPGLSSAIFLAVKGRYFDVVGLLMEYGATVTEQLLATALQFAEFDLAPWEFFRQYIDSRSSALNIVRTFNWCIYVLLYNLGTHYLYLSDAGS